MNPVEIEEAISELAELPFNPGEFPFQFLAAFGNKDTTLKKLRSTTANISDIPGAVLQRNNIHLAVASRGGVSTLLDQLRESPKTKSGKAKFILATDGETLEAEDLSSGETIACSYQEFPNQFGFFLPLAGISTVKQIRENTFDIRATGRLNKLYTTLLQDNPEWATEARRSDMNHFLARLIFCFFAEDTDIFHGQRKFTGTIERMSAKDSSDTHEVISTLFRAMNTPRSDRTPASTPRWAADFPYVNGGLFAGSMDVPRFSKIARSYLLHIGNLDWTKVNPDIFGSMIQAVADEGERGSLGMHYTSRPNILKVLNPLFLDDLREKLEAAGDNARMLLNLRKRMSKIRVFDPACGSGNFLVIAYKEMRAIEAEINRRRSEPDRRSDIPLTNFRGIEINEFPAEIARLALVIAEYQCDVLHRGQQEALQDFLPLAKENWITCGNALRLDWFSVCPPTGAAVRVQSNDLFSTPLDQAEIDFENEGGETYICGNPPYLGSTWQDAGQKADLERLFGHRTQSWKSLDYVAGWFMKAADYGLQTPTVSALVSTNSICQGQQVPIPWPLIFATGYEIVFAHTSFKWANLAAKKAGVTVAIIGMGRPTSIQRKLYTLGLKGGSTVKEVDHINAYLVPAPDITVNKKAAPSDDRARMDAGGKPVDGGHLFLTPDQRRKYLRERGGRTHVILRAFGASEYIKGDIRYCLWLSDADVVDLGPTDELSQRLEAVRSARSSSPKLPTRTAAAWPHRFEEVKQTGREVVTIVPKVSSETREYLPAGLLPPGSILTDLSFGLYDAPLWNLGVLSSRLHLVWLATVCGKLETRYRYSNTLGWNTFPLPKLTDQNKADLTRCAEGILLAREAHFPATIADLYDPDSMPKDLRAAHDRNDETLERIYIGRRFKNDTERLEKLFEMYTRMTKGKAA